jgi:hypothetical protein
MNLRNTFAWLALLLVLLIGVPLFIRTPLWVDATYHDLSARNLLQHGVHYRDIFETNFPGMVWLHCAVRSAVGWSHEAIRLVDLVVMATSMLLLARLMRTLEITLPARLWFLTAVSLFYLYETEFIHVQRDGWMLLPTILATLIRIRQSSRHVEWTEGLSKLQAEWEIKSNSIWSVPGLALLEGMLWGCAVWIKPHALVPAFAVWLASLRFFRRREIINDVFGLVFGGLLVGGIGTVWLMITGTWSHMWDVMLNWNGEYYDWSWKETLYKIRVTTAYFAPFSLLHVVALPLALYAIVRKEAARALIGALYLGWLAEAALLQKTFDYAHAPPTLLAIAVIALYRLPIGPVLLVWCVLGSLANEHLAKAEWFKSAQQAKPITMTQMVPAHSIARWSRLQYWPRCWQDNSLELKDRLTYYRNIHCAPEWENLHLVAEYLRTQEVGDGDVICWHDATHPLYLELNIKPGIRFPHVITVMRMKSKIPTIRDEAFRSSAKFIVSDLMAVAHIEPIDMEVIPSEVDRLPSDFPNSLRDVYPWNQPPIYRVGRYMVHRVDTPRGEIDFPLPGETQDLTP